MIISMLKYFKRQIAFFIKCFFSNGKIDIKDKNAYLFLSPDYGNLGDVAIKKAIKDFIDKYSDYNFVPINVNDTFKYIKYIHNNIKKKDLIVLIGGGNNGSLYPLYEEIRQIVLKKFKKNRIISFPQSVCFEDSFYGRYIKRKFVDICNNCEHLVLIAREKITYSKYLEMDLKKNVKILLIPDIVFSLDKGVVNNFDKRNNALFLFRNDKEKASDIDYINQLSKLKAIGEKYKIEVDDTCKDISIENLEYELEMFLKKIAQKQIVFTDRLHGMIMCYITNTPCIVFDNSNKKISSTYHTWIKKQNFIIYENNFSIEKIEKDIKTIENISKIEKGKILDRFNELISVLREDKNE